MCMKAGDVHLFRFEAGLVQAFVLAVVEGLKPNFETDGILRIRESGNDDPEGCCGNLLALWISPRS